MINSRSAGVKLLGPAAERADLRTADAQRGELLDTPD